MTTGYEPKDPAVMADPFPALRELQAHDPVHWSRALSSWVLTRYDDVKTALNDPRFSADRITPFLAREPGRTASPLAELGRTVGLWAVFTDPPKHTRLRGFMNTAFTPRAVENLRGSVQEIVEALIDRVVPQGRLDLIREFAYRLPVAVIGDLLGVPREDGESLKRWSDDLAAFVGSATATPDKYERAGRSVREMGDYFRKLGAARRARPRTDIISVLATGERNDGVSDDELVATCILLLFAGHETTTNLIGNGMLALLRNRDQYEAWRDDPSVTATAVEELLRYDGPGQALVRIAADDVVLEGRRIARGDRIFLMLNAANRDPRRFETPDRLDLRRQPNPHLTFGYGIHYCVGAPLARLEAQLAFPALLRRLPDLGLADEPLEWMDSLVFRGVRALPLTFSTA